MGAQGNPYHDKYRGAYGYPTSMDHCKAEDLTVTRTAGDGSLLEAIGGMIGSVQTAASVEDCSVEDLVADLTAEDSLYISFGCDPCGTLPGWCRWNL